MIVLCISTCFSSCYYDVEEELYPYTGCDTTNVTYKTRIQPILQNNCIVCHNASLNSGNLNFENFADVKSIADDTRFYGAVTHAEGYSPMPKGGNKLTDCEIRNIRIWISDGALNN